jgi:hypothetical protein
MAKSNPEIVMAKYKEVINQKQGFDAETLNAIRKLTDLVQDLLKRVEKLEKRHDYE